MPSLRELTTKSKSPSQLNGAVILSEANLRSETSEQPRRNLYDDVTRQFRKAANLMELDPNIRNILATTAQWLNVRLVAEGASGPTNPDGDTIMQMRGIEVIPDILCNAGGVICAHGGLHRRALAIGDGLQRTGYLSVGTRLSYCR